MEGELSRGGFGMQGIASRLQGSCRDVSALLSIWPVVFAPVKSSGHHVDQEADDVMMVMMMVTIFFTRRREGFALRLEQHGDDDVDDDDDDDEEEDGFASKAWGLRSPDTLHRDVFEDLHGFHSVPGDEIPLCPPVCLPKAPCTYIVYTYASNELLT